MLATFNGVPLFDRVLDDVMGSALGYATNPELFTPAVDVIAKESEVVFHLDVPGVKLENIEVTLENHVLEIKGSRTFEAGQDERLLIGRAFGGFQLTYRLPETVDDDKLTACLADGVLTLRVPKLPKAQPRKIQIGGGSTGSTGNQLGQ
jgi:HSP20 family protein